LIKEDGMSWAVDQRGRILYFWEIGTNSINNPIFYTWIRLLPIFYEE
jgi:hypothetical protein